jgi:hypothetical protein
MGEKKAVSFGRSENTQKRIGHVGKRAPSSFFSRVVYRRALRYGVTNGKTVIKRIGLQNMVSQAALKNIVKCFIHYRLPGPCALDRPHGAR